jgi:hypothetical protein
MSGCRTWIVDGQRLNSIPLSSRSPSTLRELEDRHRWFPMFTSALARK